MSQKVQAKTNALQLPPVSHVGNHAASQPKRQAHRDAGATIMEYAIALGILVAAMIGVSKYAWKDGDLHKGEIGEHAEDRAKIMTGTDASGTAKGMAPCGVAGGHLSGEECL